MTLRRWMVAVWSAVALLAVLVLGPVAALVLTGAVVGGRAFVLRSARRRRDRAREDAVPELVDLFLLAASAGLPVVAALRVVADRAPPPVRPAVARAHGRIERGTAVGVALADLGEGLGPSGAELADALSTAAGTGAPLVAVLERVATVAHDRRARAAEAAARRLPVTLLFPLACCVLPAAVLLAVVPVIVSSLGSLTP